MKRIVFLLMLAFAGPNLFSQATQPQGEYHKYIVKKTDDERKKTKGKEWWGAGVIMFATEDIPRMGRTKEVEAMLKNSFKAKETFVGRVYLPRAVGKMDVKKPEALSYRLYVDDKSTPYLVNVGGDVMPDATWSSWLLDFPKDFNTAFNQIEEGTHKIRIEIWSSREVETTTVYTDENNKAVAYSKDNDNKGKFWAAGEFTLTK